MNAELTASHLRALLCSSFMVLGSALSLAAPTSLPTIKQWFDQLADANTDVREQAIANLMGLTRHDLPMLRTVVEESRPIRPSQAAALRDIVAQVYLAGESYEPDEGGLGFLGLRWLTPVDDVSVDPGGIVVEMRLPGFVAYRMLRDGDVVVGIAELPGVQFQSRGAFIQAIGSFKAGDTITLLVYRSGRQIRVPVRLDARPAALRDRSVEDVLLDRVTRADEYWNATFRALVDAASDG